MGTLKIKKVDDKPMVIHTKKKAKIHMHEPKKAKIKGWITDEDIAKAKEIIATVSAEKAANLPHPVPYR